MVEQVRRITSYTMKKAAISLPMNRCDQEYDLGVLFTPDLKPVQSACSVPYTYFSHTRMGYPIRIWAAHTRMGNFS